MFYSKSTILEKIKSKSIEIIPFVDEFLDPVSYELHLGAEIQEIEPQNQKEYSGNSPKEKESSKQLIKKSGYLLLPGYFVTAKTQEKISIDNQTVAFFDGKASLAQIGLFSHMASMLIEPGFEGNITCEIFNGSKYPIRLFKSQKIGQIFFAEAL